MPYLLTLAEMPTEEMVKHLAAPGFGCQFVSCEDVTLTDENNSSWQQRTFYCRSQAEHPCGRFWLELTVRLKNDFVWYISAGDLTARTLHADEFEEPERLYSNGLRSTYAARTAFYVDSPGSLEIYRKGSAFRTEQHDIERYDARLRWWLARGSFFMGLRIQHAV